MARSFYGIFWFFVFLAIVNSTIANANAGVNVSSRTAFAMGRIRAFPHFLGQVHHRYRSPVNAILAGTVATIAIMLGLGLGYGPEVAFAMAGTGIVIILAAIYIVVDAACIGFFARRGRAFNPLLHLVIPVLGIAAFVPAWPAQAVPAGHRSDGRRACRAARARGRLHRPLSPPQRLPYLTGTVTSPWLSSSCSQVLKVMQNRPPTP